MANEITAAELVANVRAKMDMLPADMAKAESIVTGAAKRMSSGAGAAGSGVGASLGGGIQKGLASFLGGGAGMILGGGIAAGVALIGKELVGAATQAAEYGRQQARIGASFVDLWGSQAPDAMNRLRAASQGTINDMDLMLAANKASMLGVGSGIGDLTKLMQVAQERGRAMGLTTAQAFSDIVTGIGRMSPLILDNLGIVTDAENTYAAYAATLGKDADALTDLEKKQALVARVTAEAGATAIDSAGKHEQLRAAKENLRGEIGSMIDAWVSETGVIEAATKALNDQADAIENRQSRAAQIAGASDQFTGMLESVGARAMENPFSQLAGQLAPFRAEMDALDAQYKRGQITLYDYNAALNAHRMELARIAGVTLPELVQMGANWTRSQEIIKASTDGATTAAAQLSERAAELESREGAVGIAAEKAAIGIGKAGGAAAATAEEMAYAETKALTYAAALRAVASASDPTANAMQTARFLANSNPLGTYRDPSSQYAVSSGPVEGAYGGYGANYAGVERSVKDAQAGYDVMLAAQKGYAGASIDTAQEQFDAIRGIVESALSPTAVTAADLAATAAGAYVDKWDEYMRRVRMPESGMGADQIAEQERLFYSGQMMDQINWSAVVADVGRKVQEEAGRQAMIDEAMRQVAAAGIGASQSQVAAAMGVTGYAAGTGEAEQIGKGLSATGLGVQFTDQFAEEFNQQQQRWVDMGTLSVQWMATGIERGTTPGVTQLLINLLAPKLAEALGGPRP